MKNSLLLILLCSSVIAAAQHPIEKIANGQIQGATNADKTVRIF